MVNKYEMESYIVVNKKSDERARNGNYPEQK